MEKEDINFHKEFFSVYPEVKWIGSMGIVRMDERNAEIIVSTLPSTDGGIHEGYIIRIISKQSPGIVSRHTFKFEEYLRTKNGKKVKELILYCQELEPKWKPSAPTEKSLANMATAIVDYIYEYR